MNRRGAEFASALLLMVGTTFGCARQNSTLEFNTQARATETAQWQNDDPQAIYLGSVIITPDSGLNVRSFPRKPLFDPDNKIKWEDIIRINGLLINSNKFSIKYPTLVYGPNVVNPSDLTSPNNAPWIQLDAQVNNNGEILNKKAYLSFADNPRSYMQLVQSSDSKIAKLISRVSRGADGLLVHSTGEVIPNSEASQVSTCNTDNSCIIPKNESEFLAQERLLSKINRTTYVFGAFSGDDNFSQKNNNVYESREEYLQYNPADRLPIYIELVTLNDRLGISWFDNAKVVMLTSGGNVRVCAPISVDKKEAYQALFENFRLRTTVDKEFVETLARGVTICR